MPDYCMHEQIARDLKDVTRDVKGIRVACARNALDYASLTDLIAVEVAAMNSLEEVRGVLNLVTTMRNRMVMQREQNQKEAAVC